MLQPWRQKQLTINVNHVSSMPNCWCLENRCSAFSKRSDRQRMKVPSYKQNILIDTKLGQNCLNIITYFLLAE